MPGLVGTDEVNRRYFGPKAFIGGSVSVSK